MNKAKEFVSAHFVTRLLIVSYFTAVALNLIRGAEIGRLADPFMAGQTAEYTMRAFVLVLCGLVLFGVLRRPAALVLALVVFWSSYLTLYAGGDIGAFWRDLALIGGLLLTANIVSHIDQQAGEDRMQHFDTDEHQAQVKADHRQHAESEDLLFREDFDIVRAN